MIYNLLQQGIFNQIRRYCFGISFACLLLGSCKIYQPAYYFKDITRDTVITGFETTTPALVIQKKDLLTITVSSLSPVEDALFTKTADGGAGGYLVDGEGNIVLHKLGKIQVAGLSRQQVKDKLETSLTPYLKEPLITVAFANHRVTVLGETSSQVVEMPEEKIPLLEVMAKANPVTQNSAIDRVLVIRETPGAKEFKHLNLQSPGFITSPWYFLQPNDVVIVKPNPEKVESEARRIRNQLLYTTVLSGITFIFLIIDRIFR